MTQYLWMIFYVIYKMVRTSKIEVVFQVAPNISVGCTHDIDAHSQQCLNTNTFLTNMTKRTKRIGHVVNIINLGTTLAVQSDPS